MAITARDRRPAGASSGRPAEWLMLAAAPLFAVMTLVTVLAPAPDAALLCGDTAMGVGGIGFGGMTVMYGLMAFVHLAPWLRLIAGSSRA